MKSFGILYDADQDDLMISVKKIGDVIQSGIITGDVSRQNQAFLLGANKGDFKLEPEVGVGIVNFINDNDSLQLTAEIRTQFEKDGLKIKKLEVAQEAITIDASY